MKERPILFSTDMVSAILDGRKTQTRRVVRAKLSPILNNITWQDDGWYQDEGNQVFFGKMNCPYGKPGERLWVRETWRIFNWWEDEPLEFQYKDLSIADENEYSEPTQEYIAWRDRVELQCCEDCESAGIKADDEGYYRPDKCVGRWRPSIFMPRWASRLTLEIVNVRVERLQEIRGYGCIAELGLDGFGDAQPVRWKFRDLWNNINGKRAPWASNPWVWCVSFRKLENAS